jgi:hypothetical protein
MKHQICLGHVAVKIKRGPYVSQFANLHRWTPQEVFDGSLFLYSPAFANDRGVLSLRLNHHIVFVGQRSWSNVSGRHKVTEAYDKCNRESSRPAQ